MSHNDEIEKYNSLTHVLTDYPEPRDAFATKYTARRDPLKKEHFNEKPKHFKA